MKIDRRQLFESDKASTKNDGLVRFRSVGTNLLHCLTCLNRCPLHITYYYIQGRLIYYMRYAYLIHLDYTIYLINRLVVMFDAYNTNTVVNDRRF